MNWKLKSLMWALAFCFIGTSFAYAQEPTTSRRAKISDFEGQLKKGKYDTTIVQIRPKVWDMNAPTVKRNYHVYGVLICWKINGKQKSARQDMTSDILKNEVYEYTLAISKNSKVTQVEFDFFDATKPRSTWPEQSSCF